MVFRDLGKSFPVIFEISSSFPPSLPHTSLPSFHRVPSFIRSFVPSFLPPPPTFSCVQWVYLALNLGMNPVSSRYHMWCLGFQPELAICKPTLHIFLNPPFSFLPTTIKPHQLSKCRLTKKKNPSLLLKFY